ncbi:pantetheine-phosphate adenylyltransferase [Campylobacter fetus]|uniref:Phosphopantetheine adenylyltransferase n=1 Tax=Campylobacter fetus subsp. testudinum TaxID=1507806 RepID=A0AAX0HBR4_CAMFE|nr:pantetheine-phosphate adenylyltransferase [Campylobacter fetus]AGZ81753.1 phosphopantetheine adenylyltransferase [Campylobacter fetus subsp. testudinum 03-427]AJB45486.1 phosphopantetheine adenylyltransferase [Campylobacter fetus subsp. testudinum]ALV64910.1 phosphopantetheine adenylyltransferase [Campylobacter fetus subsp. testudinum Sp3]AVK81156.1 pantetheine-phosphate adenylyltransferase [Campylobacter fetus subsp. testudinum]EAI4321269.1 pantetheine-phosphate adenylyltransferase [Campyl
MNKSCIYPGTFDPITNGHMDVIKRACRVFDNVIVAVALNESKTPYFCYEKRISLAKTATKDIPKVSVIGFDNLLVDFAKSKGINTVVRGLRAVSDFEYELQIGYANASLWSEFETVYFMPSLKNAFISSSIVRSVLKHGGDIRSLVPISVLEEIKGKLC